jgi:5-(carboxyamino)imidazole ribonucleotide synthase
MHIAIIGCGQLSRMLALAGLPLSLKFSFVADSNEVLSCVEGLGKTVRWQSGDSVEALFNELGQPDVVTVEKEQVNMELLEALSEYCTVRPGLQAIYSAQHRHREKCLLDKLTIPNSAYRYNSSAQSTADKLGLPLVAKSCTEGYDGKNQWVLKTADDVAEYDKRDSEDECIIEQWIPFNRELSQVSARNSKGEIVHYALTENVHTSGILKQSIAPAPDVSDETRAKAQDYITRILTDLDYVGVLAMECFDTGDELLVNELAPRVHNSGHWTQSGARTCQFENHVRAVADLPLGDTAMNGNTSGMVNLLGTSRPPVELLSGNSTLHWYNKSVRPGRKLGHINFVGEAHDSLLQQMQQVTEQVDKI